MGRYSVRRIRHRDGRESWWIFTPDGEVHRPSLAVLTRYGTSTQQTYAYSLADHLNWLYANNRDPATIVFDDLRRYMGGVSGRADGVYGVPWRRPEQKPSLGTSAAGNVATVVKAFYLSLQTSPGGVRPELIDALTSGRSFRSGRGRCSRAVESNPLAPKQGSRRPRFLPDEVVQALFEPGVLTTVVDAAQLTLVAAKRQAEDAVVNTAIDKANTENRVLRRSLDGARANVKRERERNVTQIFGQ